MSDNTVNRGIKIEFYEQPQECCLVTVGEWVPKTFGVRNLCFDCGNGMKALVSEKSVIDPTAQAEDHGQIRHFLRDDVRIYSVIFGRSSWPYEKAIDWLQRNGFKSDQMVEKLKSFIFTQCAKEELDMEAVSVLTLGVGLNLVLSEAVKAKKKDEKASHPVRSDGSCPPGFKRVGNRCVMKDEKDKEEEKKKKDEKGLHTTPMRADGTCPEGFKRMGNQCVKKEDAKKEEDRLEAEKKEAEEKRNKQQEVDESIALPPGGVCPAQFPVKQSNRCLTRKEARRRRFPVNSPLSILGVRGEKKETPEEKKESSFSFKVAGQENDTVTVNVTSGADNTSGSEITITHLTK